ncbi:MAG TPA: thiamine diphosphokinase [Tenuifilaceae bacterium]|nr:thiamine diphosphokinase [Bacteroidales bacterium]MDI9516825.1 thiamine diphosphokinase [Bacteroidota bacterium]NLH57335.1 thiamine diphosphokinase [Rikenellaceae bacterium]OQC64677.1 MAG: Thiamin pyrophosphokinase, catalytic domain [Bacteroidetes bacterium ADurb.Bin008]HNV81013.1 thiamine diphosphokinase [Tenuifilaceae bacterium]
MSTVILANGRFPTHPVPLSILKNATRLICCDGAANNMEAMGLTPTAIVGDLDSLSEDLKGKYSDRLFQDTDTETNDLTKAVKWCRNRGYHTVSILAGTGLREDHAIGNIGLLPQYLRMGMDVTMVTDHGTLVPMIIGGRLSGYPGQAVSVFSFDNSTAIHSKNLEYPIGGKKLVEPWMGTLNRCMADWFKLEFTSGMVVVFRSH